MNREPIAIVGIGCRMPGGATTPQQLWELLCSGRDAVGEVPADRWDLDEYYDPNPDQAGKIKTRRGGFVEGIDLFDNEYFNMFPAEAERVDPQQRFLLMAAHEAIEDAGDAPARLRGSKTAVFVGHFMNDYWDMQVDPSNRYAISPHVAMGSSITALSNRLSYLFDLKGPSMTLDTACSSSLVAAHLACQSIWRGDADAALAGGVNLMINPVSTVMMSKGGFLSPDGACKAFDETANGYVRSEGVGVVYLKRLSQALADGNQIYGVVKGSACNSDGYTPEGFTVPSVRAQATMLAAAYRDAGVDPASVQYVEAHGTGTPVGDPIETRAFSQVFGQRERALLIGSVKTNIGHMEGAAGVAGLIKLCLCMKNQMIPGNLHFHKANPNIDLEGWKLAVVSRTTAWPEPAAGMPRRGGVNSFGAGGTNAHLVLEQAPAAPVLPAARPDAAGAPMLFVLSAPGEAGLRRQAEAHARFLAGSEASLASACKAAGRLKSGHRQRLAVVAASTGELADKLAAFARGEQVAGVESGAARGGARKLAFVFTGQGPQWHAMGRELMETDATFRRTLDEIERLFVDIAGWSLLDEMRKGAEDSRVSDTRVAQPAIMAVQIGLVDVWRRLGVSPAGVVGHSIGEVAAAYTAGALTLAQATRVIYHRSRGQHAATGKGKMLAVSLGLKQAEALIAPHAATVSIGAVNGPASVTLSGDEAPLQAIARALTERDVFNKFLTVNVPFHSHHMAPLKDELIASLADLRPAANTIALYSTVTGELGDGLALVSPYWYANVREPVYFAPAIDAMLSDGYDLFVELGPHPALSAGVEDTFAAAKADARILPSLRRKEPERARVLQTLGALYVAGLEIDFDLALPDVAPARLPPYAWDLKPFWCEPAAHRAWRTGRQLHPLVAGHAPATGAGRHAFDLLLDRRVAPYLDDHRVNDVIIFPATGHLETATAAARAAFGASFGFLEDIHFESGLFLPDDGEMKSIRLEVDSGEHGYAISSRDGADWIRHSRGKMNAIGDLWPARPAPQLALLRERIAERLPVQPLYNELKQAGLQYGPSFRAIETLWSGADELLAKVALHDSIGHGADRYCLHPAVLDACLHVIFAARSGAAPGQRGFYLPVHIAGYKHHRQPAGKTVWSHVEVKEASDDYLRGDFRIYDDEGALVAEVRDLRCKYIEGSRQAGQDIAYAGCYEYRWRAAPEWNLKPAPTTALWLAGEDEPDSRLRAAVADAGVRLIRVGLDPDDAAGARAALLAALRAHPNVSRIALPLFAPRAEQALAMEVLNLFQALVESEAQASIWLLARDELAGAPLKGMARVLRNEQPQIVAKLAWLDPDSQADAALFASILGSTSNAGNETELRCADGVAEVLRLTALTRADAVAGGTHPLPAHGSAYEAYFKEPTILESIAYRRTHRPALDGDAVEIAVQAAGLNFKDVLNGMGLLSAESVEGGLVGAKLGLECSGVVTRVGARVTRWRAGDEVIAIAPKSLAGLAVTPEHCVARKPAGLSHAQAAGLTIVYLTAYHTLIDVARLERGELVLIQSAAGGVGLAAIEVAKQVGARIYASAGTEAKRAMLLELGVERVYDSRALDFHSRVMADTGGAGVDVVLNSLSGPALTQGLKCLGKFGRFVEIGKTDIYADASLNLKRFGENLSFHAVDIDRLMAQRPAKGARLFERVAAWLAEGRLAPLPIQTFAMSALAAALTELSKGRHSGKIVVTMAGDTVPVEPLSSIALRPDAVYAVTGGASGFGIEIAKWLVEKGARRLSLASRGGPKSDYDRHWIAHLRERGVAVGVERVDLASAAAVDAWLDGLERDGAPIGGLVHGAASLRDATIPGMTGAMFEQAWSAKAVSGRLICERLARCASRPDFVLMLSSISSVFGLPGQFNYAAANNALDALAQHWSARGMCVKSVNLGVLGAYAGMSKDAGAVMGVLDSQGWTPLTLPQVYAKMEALLAGDGVVRMAANLDWVRFREFFPHLRSDQKFAHLMSDEALKIGAARQAGDSLRERLEALVEGEAVSQLTDLVKTALARILGTTAGQIATDKPLSAMGLDSLMMNQLRNWITLKLEINYPLMKMVKGPTLREMSAHLLAELRKSGVDAGSALPAEADDELELVAGWFMRRKAEPARAGAHKLFMFHSMGAAASMFGHFLYHPPAGAEVWCIQLPGRENRAAEAPYTNLTQLLDDLEAALLPLLDEGGYSFYGHSFGGIVAFELARRLRRHGREPRHLFCSATMAPHITLTWKNRDVMRESTISSNSEQKLLGLMSYIDDVDFVRQILPGMRRDMPLLMGYDYQEQAPLSCPVTVFSALEDEVTLPEEMAAWRAQTTGAFRQELVHGDHWFVSRNKEYIQAQLSQALGG